MQPLPANPYEPSIWSEQTILLDYTVTDGLNKYSVPYDLIGEVVSVRITRDAVEIFFNGNRVAVHPRDMKRRRDPITVPSHIEAIEYHEDRELDKGLITKLATCAYIRENHHVILKGATGAGKSYIANALGVAACRKLYKVRYVSLPDLLNEYAVAKALNTQNKVKTAYF